VAKPKPYFRSFPPNFNRLKIAVNARLLLPDKLEGIGWFAYETLSRIVKKHPEHTFYFLFDRPYDKRFIFADNVKPVVVGPPARHPILWYIWFQWRLPRKLKKIRPDIFVSPENYMPPGTDIPSLIVMHDLAYEHYPETVPKLVRRYYKYFFPRFGKEAKQVATVSEFTRQDIHKTYSLPLDKISVVFNGVNEDFYPLPEDERAKVRAEYSEAKPYFFFVGGLYPRKNIGRLIEAFELFKGKTGLPHKLLIAGRAVYGTDTWIKQAKESTYSSDIKFLGRVKSQGELNRLYNGAEALAYVSLFEGFGIPCLEAMRCGTPVVASNISSLPEVCGDAAFYVEPESIEAIADGLTAIAKNENLRNELREKGLKRQAEFTWDRTADLLWEAVRKVSSQP
jgi:glycosyltransferase involved in cell wall biosynthesis